MMRDREAALAVHDRLGEAFNVEDHAALAAYLYAFYAQDHDPDVGRFIGSLQDERLERAAAAISMMEDVPFDEDILAADIEDISKVPAFRELELKKEEAVQAERAGDYMLAAQMHTEINALERQLKGR